MPEVIIPDNLKAGIQRPYRYEPALNPTHQDFDQHHGVAVIPQTYGVAVLRDCTFLVSWT
jgi:hypothetical protein